MNVGTLATAARFAGIVAVGAGVVAGAAIGLRRLDEWTQGRAERLESQPLDTVEQRIRAVTDLDRKARIDHSVRAALLVRAFDLDGDGRVARAEWKLQAGSDALDASKLFDVAARLADGGVATGDDVGVDDVRRLLDTFGSEPFRERDIDASAARYEAMLAPRTTKEQDDANERPVLVDGFTGILGRRIVSSRSASIAAAELMTRFDTDRDDRIDRKRESTYSAGDFRSDARDVLDFADADDDGVVTFRELRSHLATFDVSKPGDSRLADPKAGASGLLEFSELEAAGVLEL